MNLYRKVAQLVEHCFGVINRTRRMTSTSMYKTEAGGSSPSLSSFIEPQAKESE